MKWFIFLFIFFFAANLQARQQYKSDIPANRGVFGECNVCHNDIAVNRSRNDFGQRAQSFSDGSSVSWSGSVYRGLQLFEHDTDGDGYSNGYELGDPTGVWDANQPHPSSNKTYNPSDPNDNPCGNGTIEGPEDCEGNSVDGSTCLGEGYEAGTLTCNGCFFDFTACGPKIGGTNNGTNNNTNNATGPTNNTNNQTNNATTNNNPISNSNPNSNSKTTTHSTTTALITPPTNNRPGLMNNINGTGGCSSTRSFSSLSVLFAFALLFTRRRRKKTSP